MNASMSIHRVKSVRVGSIESRKVSRTGDTYFTRDVVVETDDGSQLKIVLFSDGDDGLLLDRLESASIGV